jgi:hypothetical protein
LEDEPQYDFRGRHFHPPRALHPQWYNLRRFIEESLANAFVLKQNVKTHELDFLKEFTAAQPQGYKQGGLWSGNLGTTLRAAQTWACFKRKGDDARWNFVFEEHGTPPQILVDRLKLNQSISSIDFVRDFYQHLLGHVGAWQKQFEEGSPVWNERLNGIFGVLYTLTTWGNFSPRSRLKLLRQWAANGSPEGFDELHKTIADTAQAQGKYRKSLQHQRIRLEHLPKLQLNDYWLKHHTEQIVSLISELEALIG